MLSTVTYCAVTVSVSKHVRIWRYNSVRACSIISIGVNIIIFGCWVSASFGFSIARGKGESRHYSEDKNAFERGERGVHFLEFVIKSGANFFWAIE